MIKTNSSTILGLDISINGTGIVVISNDPDLCNENSIPVNGTKYFILHASYVKGQRKKGLTEYTQFIWGDNTLTGQDKKSVDIHIRGGFVFNEAIKDLLSKYNPTQICIEGYAYAGKGAIFDIAEFTGIVKYMVREHYGFNFTNLVAISPTALKKYIAKNGKADKDRMMYWVSKKYDLDFLNDNITDAFGLAIMGAELGSELVEYSKNATKRKKKAKQEIVA